MRTPAFVYAPALIGNGTRALHKPIHIADWWRTLADAGGVAQDSPLEYLRTSKSFWKDLMTAPPGDGAERWPREAEQNSSSPREGNRQEAWQVGPSKEVLELNFLNAAAYDGKYKMTATLANLVDMGESGPHTEGGRPVVGLQPPGAEEPFMVQPVLVIGKEGYKYDVDVEFFDLENDDAEVDPLSVGSLLPGGDTLAWVSAVCDRDEEVLQQSCLSDLLC